MILETKTRKDIKIIICPPGNAIGYKEEPMEGRITIKNIMYEVIGEPADPMRRLCIAMLRQALTDLKIYNAKEPYQALKAESFRWLFRDKKTFPIIADSLGYKPRALRKKLIIFVRSEKFQHKF